MWHIWIEGVFYARLTNFTHQIFLLQFTYNESLVNTPWLTQIHFARTFDNIHSQSNIHGSICNAQHGLITLLVSTRLNRLWQI